MELRSSAFDDGGTIPVVYCATGVAGGRNVSPPLEWTAPPDDTRSMVLTVVDHHPVAGMWVHWAIVDIPPEAGSLAAGASGAGDIGERGRELLNTYGTSGWGGPQPPRGTGVHEYVFTLLALDVTTVDLPVQPTAADVAMAVAGHRIASATLTGMFGR